MVQNKAEIASESIYNPRASRALERAPAARDFALRAHILPPPPPNQKIVLALLGYAGVSSGPFWEQVWEPLP